MRAMLILLLLSAAGCLSDYDVEGMTYPCRTEEDCVDGFECHETRYVCVEDGTGTSSISAEMPDAG